MKKLYLCMANINILTGMRRLIFLILTIKLLTGLSLMAQKSENCECVLSGTVKDSETKEPIIGAVVYLKGTNKAVNTDEKGHYILKNICQGNYRLVCQLVGYQSVELVVDLKKEHAEDIALVESDEHLQEVIVSGKKVESFSQVKNTLEGQSLEQSRGQNLGESLKGITGVTSLQTGSSISKPVIHGMHSNRVLILNNGVRQEGQQWGSEHAPEIDPFVAKKLSVVKGAAGVRYGSDAIAGVILVEPDDLPDSSKITGELNTVGFSNGRQGVISGILQGGVTGLKGLSWRVQGTLKKGGNVSTSSYNLANTGVEEQNFSLTTGYKKANWGTEIYFSRFSNLIGIFLGSHIGNKEDLEDAIARNRPLEIYTPSEFSYTIDRPYQDITHNLLKSKSFLKSDNFGKLNLTLSRQFDRRYEYDVLRAGKNVNTLRFLLETYTGELLLEHKPVFHKLSGMVGLSGMYQENVSSGDIYDKPQLTTTLIPNFQNQTMGVFIIERLPLKKFDLEAGFRFDQRNLNVYRPTQSYSTSITQKQTINRGLSGNLGVNYRFSTALSGKFNAGTAWRAPTVNELYSYGVHHGAAAFEIGDSTLAAEKAYNFSLIFEYTLNRLSAELNLYNNYINDFIYLKPGFTNGVPDYILTVRGAFPEFNYTQVDAVFRGIDFSLHYQITDRLSYTGKYAMVRAKDVRNNLYMVNIPSDRIENTVKYEFGKKHTSFLSIGNLFVAHQNRVEANSDFVAPPAAYSLMNIQAGTAIKNFEIGLGVSNLFNVSYREYLNRFRYFTDDMGRNVSLRVKWKF